MKADLHTHSLYSDGTQTPTELVESAHKAGITTLALTDHDTMNGWDEAREACKKYGITFIPGIEVTSRLNDKSVHMLAYFPDKDNQELLETLQRMRASRKNRAKKIVNKIEVDYPKLNWKYIQSLYGEELNSDKSIGKPMIADAMVKLGYFTNRSEAFDDILHSGSPYVIPQEAITPLEAVKLIKNAQGVPVIAHSRSVKRGEEVPFKYLEKLVEAGLMGIEKDHREHPETEREKIAAFAQKYNLIVTGSSDYHGPGGKPNKLAENTTNEKNVKRILDLQTT